MEQTITTRLCSFFSCALRKQGFLPVFCFAKLFFLLSFSVFFFLASSLFARHVLEGVASFPTQKEKLLFKGLFPSIWSRVDVRDRSMCSHSCVS